MKNLVLISMLSLIFFGCLKAGSGELTDSKPVVTLSKPVVESEKEKCIRLSKFEIDDITKHVVGIGIPTTNSQKYILSGILRDLSDSVNKLSECGPL